jgi:hypothetical protein
LFLAALRAPQPLGDILESRIPAAEPTEGLRFGSALVAAGRAPDLQAVGTEFIAELRDYEFARHDGNFRR